jgi:NADH-quinone oxidoreductase subunit L
MPWTYATFLVGSLSLAGIWPLAGFWSKDEIVAAAMEAQPVLFWFALITVFLTAFYMFRAIFMTFHGEYKGGDPEGDYKHTHESPWVMVAPWCSSPCCGHRRWWNITGGFFDFSAGGRASATYLRFFTVFGHTVEGVPLPLISFIIALLGIFAAWAVYIKKFITAEKLGRFFGPLYTVVYRKYFLDELYENFIVKKLLMKYLFTGFTLFDSKGVDGVVNVSGKAIAGTGRALRRTQTGALQIYGLFIALGVAVIALVVIIWG